MRLDDSNVAGYLESNGLLRGPAHVEEIGEGNLNFVRRIRCADGTTRIVKQAREGIEGLPQVRLASVRIVFEHRYQETVRMLAPGSADVLPHVMHFDAAARILVMEDLEGDGGSLLQALRGGEVPEAAILRLGSYLGDVHAATRPHAASLESRFRNDEMRRLHGEQIFAEPSCTPELEGGGWKSLQDELSAPTVLHCLAKLRREYFERKDALVHGDVKCSNVLLQDDRPRLIDAEFSHVGDPAFDLGTALAHLILCQPDGATPSSCAAAESALIAGYRECFPRGLEGSDIVARARRYAGADTVYHVLGAARLPFFADPDRAAEVVHRGLELLAG